MGRGEGEMRCRGMGTEGDEGVKGGFHVGVLGMERRKRW